MQLATGLVSLLKRVRGPSEEAGGTASSSVPAFSGEEALQGRLCSQLSFEGASSASKKRRMSAPAALAAPPPVAAFNIKVNALYEDDSHLSTNPLYSEGEEDSEADAFEPISSASSGSRISCSTGQESSPLPLAGGAASTHQEIAGMLDQLAASCSSSSGSSGDGEVAAFLRQLLSSGPVLAALTALERFDLQPAQPVWPGSASTSIAGLLVLCRRAKLSEAEMTTESLLTLLWVLESAGSQHRSSLPVCLRDYLAVLPPAQARGLYKPLKACMMGLQVQLLARCSWRVVLLDASELHAARSNLEGCPAFLSLCAAVEDWADQDGELQLLLGAGAGVLDGPAVEAAAAAAAGGCDGAAKVAGGVGQQAAPPAPRRGGRPGSTAVGRVLAPFNW